jgi:hypothetical protein
VAPASAAACSGVRPSGADGVERGARRHQLVRDRDGVALGGQVQRREAGIVDGVEVDAKRAKQHVERLLVAAGDGEVQRRVAVGVARTKIDRRLLRLAEQLEHARLAARRRRVHRGAALRVGDVGRARARLDELRGNVEQLVLGGERQRRHAVLVGRRRVGAVLEQQLGDRRRAGLDRQVQRRLAAAVGRVHLGAARQQSHDAALVAALARRHQRRLLEHVERVEARANREQQRHNVGVVAVDGEVQRRVAAAVGDVDVGLGLEREKLDGVAALLEHGDVHWRAAGVGAHVEVGRVVDQKLQLRQIARLGGAQRRRDVPEREQRIGLARQLAGAQLVERGAHKLDQIHKILVGLVGVGDRNVELLRRLARRASDLLALVDQLAHRVAVGDARQRRQRQTRKQLAERREQVGNFAVAVLDDPARAKRRALAHEPRPPLLRLGAREPAEPGDAEALVHRRHALRQQHGARHVALGGARRLGIDGDMRHQFGVTRAVLAHGVVDRVGPGARRGAILGRQLVRLAGGGQREACTRALVGQIDHSDVVERHGAVRRRVGTRAKIIQKLRREHKVKLAVAHGVVDAHQLAGLEHDADNAARLVAAAATAIVGVAARRGTACGRGRLLGRLLGRRRAERQQAGA